MLRTFCRVKLHGLTITEANLHYTGSLTLDSALMKTAALVEGEMVHVANMNNGQRLETYVIEGPAGSGVVCLNGAAARCGLVGDQIIVMAMAQLAEDEMSLFQHRSIRVDAHNRPLLEKVVS